MTLYGTVLFVHVLAAIALVGGSAWAHVTIHLMERSGSTDALRSLATSVRAVSVWAPRFALVVVAAGLYLAFAGSWWGAGWPVVALVLFVLAGAVAGAVLDPHTSRLVDTLMAAPAGPVTPEARAAVTDHTLRRATGVMSGTDLAIVFLMTNKPGWTVSIVAAVVGVGLGAAFGMRDARHVDEVAFPAV